MLAEKSETSPAEVANTAQTPVPAPFAVQLEFFSGPMDLLLHLVSQQEVEISQVKMSVICEQYLQIVSGQSKRLNLELATEYLVIAATLMAIKSKSLLPADPQEEEEEDDEIYEANRFFEDLRSRLKAYELTKRRAEALRKTPQFGIDTFTRVDRKALLPTPEMLAEPEDIFSLGNSFARLLKRIGDSGRSLKIALEPISVVSYMMRIVDSFRIDDDSAQIGGSVKQKGTQNLFSLVKKFMPANVRAKFSVEEEKEGARSQARYAVIGSFVATLELVKRGLMQVSQEADNAEISLSLRMDTSGLELSASELTSEFDEEDTPDPQAEANAALEDKKLGDKVFRMDDYRDGDAVDEASRGELEEESEFVEPVKEVSNVK